MEARQSGTGRSGGAPGKTHPLYPDPTPCASPERARAGALAAPDPAPLPGSRPHLRGHRPARRARCSCGTSRGRPARRPSRPSMPAPSSLVSTVASVPGSVYDAVGVSSPANPVTPPGRAGNGNAPTWLATQDDGPPLPVVFFYGAEFAPYAAVERWPLILALSRFGTFSRSGSCSRARRRRSPISRRSPSGRSRTRVAT